LNDLFDILFHDILPIFVGIGLGFAFGRRFKPDAQILSRIAFYIFSPCLVFTSLVRSTVASGELLQIAAFTVVVALVMGGLGWFAARLLHLDARAAAGLVLVCMFVNGGNYGLGVNQRAFGDEGLARAVIYFITSTLMVYTIGVAVAVSGGNGNGAGARHTIMQVFKVPPAYAAIIAILVRSLAIDMSQPVLEPILAGVEIIGRAAIPAMLTILGIQLAQTTVAEHIQPALVASGLRLLAAPVIAWGAAALLGLSGLARQTSILEASMPAAVINTILATEYGSSPMLVTSTVVISTLLSPFTLAFIISLLK
jgi:hypothetical protein